MRFYFPPLAVFLLLLGVWPSFHRTHEIQPTSKTVKIQKGPADGPLTTEELPLQVETFRYHLRIGFPLKPALNAEYSKVLEKPVKKELPALGATTESTSLVVLPDLLGIVLTTLCCIGSAAIVLRHVRRSRQT
jgi:hypothetical protein